MSKDSLAKQYQNNKERLQKAREGFRNLSKVEEEKKATIWL